MPAAARANRRAKKTPLQRAARPPPSSATVPSTGAVRAPAPLGAGGKPVLDAASSWDNVALAAAERPLSRAPAPRAAARGAGSGTRLRLFSGTANPKLAAEVACYLGLDLTPIKVKRFADGEVYVQVQESIRGCDVFLIQPTCPPVNDHLMEVGRGGGGGGLSRRARRAAHPPPPRARVPSSSS